jgi:dihydrolipoamide dehydrogenase
MAERYDVLVLGGGPGGTGAALRAAQLGKKVVCIDRRPTLGGTCLNVGCIPSKALLDSSELYYLAKHRFGRHGIQLGDVQLDLGQMLARKDEVVKTLTGGLAYLFKKNNVRVVQGEGKLTGPSRVEVRAPQAQPQTIEASAIVLAMGSEPVPLPPVPFDGTNVVSSTEALSFATVPKLLVVIGAGYIGLELGSVWSRLGSKVTVVEFLPHILPLNDQEVASTLYQALKRQGLDFHLGFKVKGLGKKGKQFVVLAEKEGNQAEFPGDKVLVAVGRRPVTKGIGLEQIGVELEPRSGRVVVDDGFQTQVPGIYAIGDLIEGPMLAHKAQEEGVVLAERLAGGKATIRRDLVPSVIYTSPEVAAVGLTEEQVRDRQRSYRVGKFPFKANGRAQALDDTEGFVKVLADEQTDRILGVHIIGPRASELIAEAVLAMEYSASAEDIARACHAHPTLSEALGEAARGAWTTTLNL